jgi:MFS family permease
MSYEDLNNGYATNMATLSLGCLFFVPLAHLVGRRPVYIITALVMFGCAIWNARQHTVGDMIGVNALAGLAGAVNEALFQVTVSPSSLATVSKKLTPPRCATYSTSINAAH